MRPTLVTRTALGASAAFLALGCAGPTPELLDPGAGSTIPPGAQVVHVAITERHVALSPAIVHAGPVYLVLDASPTKSAVLIGGAAPGQPDGAPLPPGALERLAGGDVGGTSATGFDAGGCSPQQDAAGKDRLGPCGNVSLTAVRAGQYAILADAPETNATRSTPLPVGVLTVTR